MKDKEKLKSFKQELMLIANGKELPNDGFVEDKEMIEEMAKDIEGEIDYDIFEYDDIHDRVIFDYKATAKNIVDKGWIKPLKDSVVLSREEYDRALKKQYQEGCSNTSKFFYELKIPKASKETAEKIYKDLKLLVPDNALGIVTRYFKEIIGIETKE